MKIVTDLSKLKQRVEPTTFTQEEQNLAAAALLTSLAKYKGLGLGANQIGLNKRICVVSVKDNPLILVNPEIKLFVGEAVIYVEGCLSIPKTMRKPIKTVRSSKVIVTTDNLGELTFGVDDVQKLKGEDYWNDLDLLEAICVQHEIDHLDGITIKDRQYNPQIVKENGFGRNEKVIVKNQKGDIETIKYKHLPKYAELGYELA
jgi:peptide deformylase